MNMRRKGTWLSALVAGTLVLSGSMLAACGQGASEDAAESGSRPEAADDKSAEQYREEVKRRVSGSVVSSFSREWDVPEAKVECVLAELSVTQLYDGAEDPAVVAVFEKCGVDPGVLE